jgi:uncharacterized membrane protein YjgN (DUF898 family)
MSDTFPAPLAPMAPTLPHVAAGPLGAAPQAGHALPITFTGSGSEYFRIWSVNLLLTLVTLGLYYPWAKVRRLRYFYGNTQVGGHALDFHGDPKRMLRGFLLVGAMVLIYSVAGQVSPAAGLMAFVIVAAIWPALFRASQRFRMANTSWRGLRFRFDGDMPGAYKAMLPLFAPGAVALVSVVFGGAQPGAAPGAFASLAGLASLGLFPLFFWLLKKYQHDHYALGQAQTKLETGAGSFYLLAAKTAGVVLLAALAAGVLAAMIGGLGAITAMVRGGGNSADIGQAFALIVLIVIVAYGSVALMIAPYLTSRLQNLVWGRTRSTLVQFGSALRFWPLLGLTLKNWLLVLLTLGLYLPFARIATTRMRLEAVSVHTALSPDELESTLRDRAANDASGDAAGDLFGIDIGL